MAHQVVVKNIAKTEFVLGLAALLVDTIGAEGFQHVQEKLAGALGRARDDARPPTAAEGRRAADEWGVVRPAWNPLDAARNLYPRLYPRMIEIVQQLGGSGSSRCRRNRI
jgi:4-hydroxyphenylacetate 3-monooxygenase